jgi:hypothetical protein
MVRGQLGRKVLRLHQNGWAVVLARWGGTDRRIKVQAGLGIKCDPISETDNPKRLGAQGVQHLAHKHEP